MSDDKKIQRNNDAPIKRFKDNDEESEHGSQGEFAEMFHDSLKQIKVGEVVKGVVVQVTQDFVLVDVGYKSEGCIPSSEFIDESGQLKVNVGDQVRVLFERAENERGYISFSPRKRRSPRWPGR